MNNTSKQVITALKEKGLEVISGKGGFWIKGKGFISLRQAQKMTNILPIKRLLRERIGAYGDWAIIAKINGIK